MRKQLLTAYLLGISVIASAQQQSFKATIQVKDSQSCNAVAFGSATTYNSNIFFKIDKGKLELRYNQKMLTDTLFIDVQGYAKQKITFADLLKQGVVKLSTAQQPLTLRASKLDKNQQLNDYNNNAVFHWIGLPMDDKPFRYLQVGQIYHNVHACAKLSKIRLNQMVLDLPVQDIYDDGSMSTGNITYAFFPAPTIFMQEDKGYMPSFSAFFLQSNKFKLRIYQVDANNQPIAELYDKPILIDQAQPVENMYINLSKYKILLPEGKFMIAVEWMPTRQNIAYTTWTKALHQMTQNYKPFIGVNEKRGNKLNVMALDYAGNWKPYDYLSPYYTDLAMQCEIEY